jgi:hypothetical protein
MQLSFQRLFPFPLKHLRQAAGAGAGAAAGSAKKSDKACRFVRRQTALRMPELVYA